MSVYLNIEYLDNIFKNIYVNLMRKNITYYIKQLSSIY